MKTNLARLCSTRGQIEAARLSLPALVLLVLIPCGFSRDAMAQQPVRQNEQANQQGQSPTQSSALGSDQVPTSADAVEQTNELRPWVVNVSEEDSRIAADLFEQGNKLFDEAVFVQAAEKYRKAVTFWDHPAIHFNLALALLHLNRPIERYLALENALRYGTAALDAVQYDRAVDYRALTRQQIVWVELYCNEADARVTINGKQVFVGPGNYAGWHVPGKIHVVATKQGYFAAMETKFVTGGETAEFILKLYTSAELMRYRRRFAPAITWSVLGTGVALLAGASFLDWHGNEAAREYDDELSGCTRGCTPTAKQESLRRRWRLEHKAARNLYVASGVVASAGAILMYLNRPMLHRIDEERSHDKVRLDPVLGPQIQGVQATLEF